MEINLRQETSEDYEQVFNTVKEAFKTEPFSDFTEQYLVDRLRKSDAFIPELSIIAEQNKEIIGHVLITKINIINKSKSFKSLALAPVSVKPAYQNKGVGGQLILTAHAKAIELGYKSIVILGHEDYYPRFGYERASKFDIKLPFEAPDENCMAIELVENGLEGVRGLVEYPKEFNESSY